MRSVGLLPDEPLDVGRLKRCRVEGDREKRGWYHLHELRLDSGDFVIVGSFGVWRGTDPGTTRVELGKAATMSPEQRAALKARLASDRKAAEAARRLEAARAAGRAQAMWRRLSAEGECDYLARKLVRAHGLRFSPSGTIAIPMLDAAGKIHGLQLIYPSGHARRKRLGRDKEYWPPGVAKQGHFFLIGSPASGGIVLLAEGYATGSSLHEATMHPVAIAFDAGNLVHVATALARRYPGIRVLVCADDDYIGKCRGCGAFTPVADASCQSCGQAHQLVNAGLSCATAAALAIGGATVVAAFEIERPIGRKGPTEFNDLHALEGLQAVRAQVEARLGELKWRSAVAAGRAHRLLGEGDGDGAGALRSVGALDELQERFALVYDAPEVVFDAREHLLVPLASMRNLCTSRQLHRQWMESSAKRIVRMREVGFDPSGRDESVLCNLWAGWPTRPREGCCDKLLELGEYLCSLDMRAHEMWRWLLCWLAYPIQHPGAKMKTAVIMHGPQGSGKNLFFEAVLSIYGDYGQIVDQDAVEDKHNDFMSRKLMLVADEVVARAEMYHAKNKLKNLITSDWVRINPKHIASYRERNHVQVVFLSNEVQPMALERDDRRYAVIWTPPKWDQRMYNAVLDEIAADGVGALHHHLLGLDLGDFGPATLPPMTEAKRDLVELGLDSSERFCRDWFAGHLPLPRCSCRSEDLYAAYRHYAFGQGVAKPAQMSTFIGTVSKQAGAAKGRHQHFRNHSTSVTMQSVVITPAGATRPEGLQPLADAINEFASGLREGKREDSSAKEREEEDAF